MQLISWEVVFLTIKPQIACVITYLNILLLALILRNTGKLWHQYWDLGTKKKTVKLLFSENLFLFFRWMDHTEVSFLISTFGLKAYQTKSPSDIYQDNVSSCNFHLTKIDCHTSNEYWMLHLRGFQHRENLEWDFSIADDNTYLQKNGVIWFGFRFTSSWREQ